MAIREKLAELLREITPKPGLTLAQTAKELGYTRQRLHQLRTADRSALPEAIEDAINKLGYEVEDVTLKKVDS